MLPHTVTIEIYEGDTSTGPRYAAPVTARAYVEDERKTVRDKQGEEVISETKVWLFPHQECPPESRVTLPSGRVASVIASSKFEFSGATPNHREVRLT